MNFFTYERDLPGVAPYTQGGGDLSAGLAGTDDDDAFGDHRPLLLAFGYMDDQAVQRVRYVELTG